jgi:hypothetical protein
VRRSANRPRGNKIIGFSKEFFVMSQALAIFIILVGMRASVFARNPTDASCPKRVLFKIRDIVGWSTLSDSRVFFYNSGLAIDADGAYKAYHPRNRGLDRLSNAGEPGNWWALQTDNDRRDGNPVVQGPSDPAPGYYVSTTALYDQKNPNPRDPRRYVDSVSIPYIVLPPRGLKFAHLGDFATVINLGNGKVSGAIIADESYELPDQIGEGSIALAEALGIDSNPRRGGQESGGIIYVVYPDSGNGNPRPADEINRKSDLLFMQWGGMSRLKTCIPNPAGE